MTKRKGTKDYDLRAALVRVLLNAGVPRSDIRHEVTLDSASSDGRADMVVVRPNTLIGLEIKSCVDKLDRLETQTGRYSSRFDFIGLVYSNRHSAAVEKMRWKGWLTIEAKIGEDMSIDFAGGFYGPQWIWLEDELRGYHRRNVSPACMLEMLDRSCVLDVARKLGYAGSTRSGAIPMLAEHHSIRQIRAEVAWMLQHRGLNRWEEAFWARFDAEPQAVAA